MSKELISKFKISLRNIHLNNIFSADAFLELGNIDYRVLSRLLSYEVINSNELADESIQSLGLGKSNIENQKLKRLLPYLYFENINHKNKAMKLVITCGLLSYYNETKEECFAPIVLIPVSMYFEGGNIFFQQTSKPEINPLLSSIFASLKLSDLSYDKSLDTFASIDKFCLLLNSIHGLKVTLENYLTYVLINEKEIKLDHDKFEVTTRTERYLNDKYYEKEQGAYYYSSYLTKSQRLAISNAMMGNNFTIVGRMGTGKTLTMFNIAMNLIIQGKRILYISNMNETLDYIKSQFEKRDLGYILADFSKPFHNLFLGSDFSSYKQIAEDDEKIDNLLQLYENINNYEKAISNRILNYRFIEVLENLAIVSDLSKKTLDIDDLSEFYKHEFEEISKSLTIIEKEYKRFCGFENSIWKAIPIHNTIRQPGQILSLISQIHQCFSILKNEQNYLEDRYGFKKIENYAMLKNVVHDVSGIAPDDIPNSWLEMSNTVFEDAKSKYRNLKNEIYHLQEVEYYLNYKYNDLSDININEEINTLLGKYFKETDEENVNKVIEDRQKLLVELNKAAIHKEIYTKTLDRVRKSLNWDFPEDNKHLGIIVRLTDFLNNNDYNKKIMVLFTYGRLQNHIEKINGYKKLIDEYSAIQNESYKMFSDRDLEKLPLYLTLLKNYKKDPKLIHKQEQHFSVTIRKHKYNDNDIDNLINRTTKMIEKVTEIRQARNYFMKLTGERYNTPKDIIQIINNINDFLNPFTREERRILIDYLLKISEENIAKTKENESKTKTLNLITKSYREIIEVYNLIVTYLKVDECHEIKDIIKKVIEYFEYIQNLCASNTKMYELLKDHTSNDVHLDKYIILRDELKDLDDTKNALENNKEYQTLYKNLYKGSQTNINTISRVLQNYEIYKSCFKDQESVIHSFDKEMYQDIKEHLDNIKNTNDNINEIFKLYCKIFKDGVSRYYYNEIGDTIEYLTMLLSSKEELTIYLNITRQIRVLNNYNLVLLEKYIIENNNVDNLVVDFTYTYFSNVKKMYLEKYSFLEDIKAFEDSLASSLIEEKELFSFVEEYYINQIKKMASKGTIMGVRNLNYRKYVRKSLNHKFIYLSTTEILNNYLDINDFDVVLIDDAHLLNSNAYHIAVDGKQVIVAGEYQLQSAVSNNLMSRMRHSSAIDFDYRFSLISKSLLNHLEGLNGIIPQKYSDNSNIEIVNEEILHYLLSNMEKNPFSKANIFIADFHKQRLVMEQISRILLQKKKTEDEVENYLRERINIADLKEGYLWNTEYNVLYLEDYYNLDIEYITANMIDNVLLAKKKLIIFDRYDYINNTYESSFLNKIRVITHKENSIFKNKYKDEVETLLTQKLRDRGMDVYPSHDDINLIVKKKGKLYGVVILFSASGLNVEVLNKYRDYYHNFKENGWHMILVSVLDLASSIDDVAKNIIKEIGDE